MGKQPGLVRSEKTTKSWTGGRADTHSVFHCYLHYEHDSMPINKSYIGILSSNVLKLILIHGW